MVAVYLCLFVVMALSCLVASKRAVVCYYGTWATYRYGQGKYDVADINPQLCTHLIYAFAGLDTEGNVVSLDPYLDLPDNYGRDFKESIEYNFGKFNALKNQNVNLKTLLAVGGWNVGSAKFSTMAASASLRQNFINSALKMITEHGFDGLDIDWEYPNRRDTIHGIADIDNFTALLKELRAAFDKKGLLLTAAVSAIKAGASQSYDVKGISKYLDMVNIMAYDMNGAWDPVTGHNAPLHKGEGDEGAVDEDMNTVEQSLKYWIGAGCPPEKIALGVPFYGRTFTLTNAAVNGVRAPTSGSGITGPYTATDGFVGYNEFCQKLQTESWTKHFDSLAKVPYAVKGKDWVSYDDAKSIADKIEYAKQLNITKIMVWSIETDDFIGMCGDGPNPLLNAINIGLGINATGSSATESSGNVFSSTSESSGNVSSRTTESSGNVSSRTTESSGNVSSSTTVSPTVAPNNDCNKEGYTAKPGDCSRFLYCIKDGAGRLAATEFKCPANLLWDQTLLSCNYPSMVDCKK